MREDLQHDFDLAEFNASARVMKCARQLFPHSERSAENWAIRAYERWTRGDGATPEMQRNARSKDWKKILEIYEKRNKTKVNYY